MIFGSVIHFVDMYNATGAGTDKKAATYMRKQIYRMGYVTGNIYMKAALDGYTLMTISFAQPRPHDGSLA